MSTRSVYSTRYRNSRSEKGIRNPPRSCYWMICLPPAPSSMTNPINHWSYCSMCVSSLRAFFLRGVWLKMCYIRKTIQTNPLENLVKWIYCKRFARSFGRKTMLGRIVPVLVWCFYVFSGAATEAQDTLTRQNIRLNWEWEIRKCTPKLHSTPETYEGEN